MRHAIENNNTFRRNCAAGIELKAKRIDMENQQATHTHSSSAVTSVEAPSPRI